MQERAHNERGETLVEVLISLIVMGIVFSAFFTAIQATSNATATQRYVVRADAVLRDSAELTKSAVRQACSSESPGSTYTVHYSSLAGGGVTPPPDILNEPCPPVTGPSATPTVPLTVTFPGPHTKSLDIAVRTP